jgi:hypothetical protein
LPFAGKKKPRACPSFKVPVALSLSNGGIGQWSGPLESFYQRATSDKLHSNVSNFDCPFPLLCGHKAGELDQLLWSKTAALKKVGAGGTAA